MRRSIKILFIAITVISILFSSAYVYMIFRGKALLTAKLESATRKKVSIGYFNVSPPFNLHIKDLNIEGLGSVKSLFISPSIPYLFMGTIALNTIRINEPEFTFERFPKQAAAAALPSITVGKPDEGTVIIHSTPKNHKAARFVFRRLSVKGGKINFIDHTAGATGIKIAVKDIDFTLNNMYVFPLSIITAFNLKGSIPWKEGQEAGKIQAEGWLNFYKKDMLATLKISDIDGIYLYPYYAQWVDLEKARIESAKLNFSSNIHGADNNVSADCHLELTDIVRKPRPPEADQEKAEKIADAMLDIFRAMNQGKIVLDFTIRTKMDRPEFGFGNIKMALEDKLNRARGGSGITAANVMMLPGKLLEGATKGATEFSKSVIDGTFAIGQELKKSVQETFKKPVPAEQTEQSGSAAAQK